MGSIDTIVPHPKTALFFPSLYLRKCWVLLTMDKALFLHEPLPIHFFSSFIHGMRAIAGQAAFIAHPELPRGQLGVNHIAVGLESHVGQT
eukprot:g25829.t1